MSLANTERVGSPRSWPAQLGPWRAGMAATVLVAAIGCGNSGVVPTTGMIRSEGQALSGGKVIFTPVGQLRPAVGEIESDGSFVLRTFKEDDGAMPGKYRVTVVADLEVGGKEAHVTFMAPKNFTVEVMADKANHLEIDMQRQTGWRRVADD